MLTEGALIPACREVRISTVLGALPDKVVDAIEHRAIAGKVRTTGCGVPEETSHQRIPAKSARLVQVAEQMFRGHTKGSVRIHRGQMPLFLAYLRSVPCSILRAVNIPSLGCFKERPTFDMQRTSLTYPSPRAVGYNLTSCRSAGNAIVRIKHRISARAGISHRTHLEGALRGAPTPFSPPVEAAKLLVVRARARYPPLKQ